MGGFCFIEVHFTFAPVWLLTTLLIISISSALKKRIGRFLVVTGEFGNPKCKHLEPDCIWFQFYILTLLCRQNTTHTFKHPPQPPLCLDNSRIWEIQVHSSGFHAPSVTAEKCWPRCRRASTRDTGLNSARGPKIWNTPLWTRLLCLPRLPPPPHTLPPLSFTVHSTLSYHSCCWHWNALGGWLASFHHRLRDSSRPNAWFNLNLGAV